MQNLAERFSGHVIEININKDKIDCFSLDDINSGEGITGIEDLEIRSSQKCAVTLDKRC